MKVHVDTNAPVAVDIDDSIDVNDTTTINSNANVNANVNVKGRKVKEEESHLLSVSVNDNVSDNDFPLLPLPLPLLSTSISSSSSSSSMSKSTSIETFPLTSSTTSSSSSSSSSSSRCARQLLVRLCFQLLFVLICASLFFVVIFFWSTLRELFADVIALLKDQTDEHPLAAALILSTANVLAALLFLPCIPFTLSAGALFGFFRGVLMVSLASMVAAIIAFFTGRYLARGFVEKGLGGEGSKWRILDQAVRDDGLKFVFLLRLSPLAPFSPMNYLFGLSSVTAKDYIIASFLGFLPTTMLEVYSGAQLKDINQIINGESSVANNVIMWVGLAVTIVTTVLITVLVRRKLHLELERYSRINAVEMTQLDNLHLEEDDENASEETEDLVLKEAVASEHYPIGQRLTPGSEPLSGEESLGMIHKFISPTKNMLMFGSNYHAYAKASSNEVMSAPLSKRKEMRQKRSDSPRVFSVDSQHMSPRHSQSLSHVEDQDDEKQPNFTRNDLETFERMEFVNRTPVISLVNGVKSRLVSRIGSRQSSSSSSSSSPTAPHTSPPYISPLNHFSPSHTRTSLSERYQPTLLALGAHDSAENNSIIHKMM